MYPVSQQFISAVNQNTRKYYWTGTITTKSGRVYKFNNEDIVKGSGYITRQCCGSTEIELGSVYAAELGITLLSTMDRYTLDGAEIEVYYHLELSNQKIETIPMGIFEISEANRTVKCLEIKAYDYMLRFDKKVENLVSSGYAYDFLTLACEKCHVELAHTEEEINSMLNGRYLLGIYFDNDIDSWRDLIYYVAQVLGSFATINRQGKLELRNFKNSSNLEISQKQRFSSNFSDFITRYSAVSSTNIRSNESEYISLSEDDALTLNLGINPLLQFDIVETRTKMLTNILQDISFINYVPFDSTTIGNPALELGDVLTFSGGHADQTKQTCLTNIQYKINGKQVLKCVGKNPKLSSAKSKNDKNISGLMNSIASGRVSVYTYINAKNYEVTTTESEIINLEFMSKEDTDAHFQAAILLDVEASQITRKAIANEGNDEFELTWTDDGTTMIIATFIINDRIVNNFQPIETYKSGKHILNLYYPINSLRSHSYNTISIMLRAVSGRATIERGGCIATISGQSIGANEIWNGRVKFDEKIGLFTITSPIIQDYIFGNIAASLNATSQDKDEHHCSEYIDRYSIASPNVLSPGLSNFNEEVATSTTNVKSSIVVGAEVLYSKDYMETGNLKFELNKKYEFISLEQPIDSGLMCTISIDTEQFDRVDGIEVEKDG